MIFIITRYDSHDKILVTKAGSLEMCNNDDSENYETKGEDDDDDV